MTDRIDTAKERVAIARRDVEDVSRLIVEGKRVPRSRTEDLRNHLRWALDALAAERSRAEKAEAERARLTAALAECRVQRDVAASAMVRNHERAEKAEAERDQALARLAAAYKAADICALTPADAEAALQRVVDAAWNEAVEACARACALMPDALPASPRMAFEAGLTACEAHILALKRPEASHD